MNRIAQQIYDLALPLAAEQGIEIWDVTYTKEAGQWFLRVYIDKPDGVGISDCETFSRAFDPILDEADPIEGSYVFEVSSAGAERELKRPSDFERFLGSNVEVKLYKGSPFSDRNNIRRGDSKPRFDRKKSAYGNRKKSEIYSDYIPNRKKRTKKRH